jgi:hypothetical protein
MGWAHGTSLRKMGFTNDSCLDLGNISTTPTHIERKAYCSSQTCNLASMRAQNEVREKHGKDPIKTIPNFTEKSCSRDAFVCPDCKNILYWETKRTKRAFEW